MAAFNPKFIDDMSWEMAEVYGAVTDQILINLAHYFPYFDANKLPASSFAYQASMLAQMGKVNRETMAIIRRMLGDADDALKKVLNVAIVDSVGAVTPSLWKAAMHGVFSAPKTPVVSPNQMRAFELYYKQAADKLNLVNTVMLESTKQAYVQAVNNVALAAKIGERAAATQTALDIGAGETITGVSAWNQAVRHSIDRMKTNGITGFIDHAGRHWSAEAYVAMDIRTTVANTARAAIWETNQSFGNDLYQVSYHNGARPLCYPWQNKVISSINNARTVVDLNGNEIQVYDQSETSYGEPAGLFGINCKHYPTPFIPGVSVIRGRPQDEEANAKTYAESQQQRALERKLREEKRDLLMLKAQGAPDDVINAQRAKCRATSAEIQDFCDATGRTRHKDREGVYTERKFPSVESYDVAAFERKQKQHIAEYYQGGGAQVMYLDVEGMKPREPLVAKTKSKPVTKQTASTDPVTQAIGVKKGKPMSIEKAVKGANPGYELDVQNTVNCQRCVQAYELRRRGYNVEAMPKLKGKANRVSWGSECFNGFGKTEEDAIRAYTFHQTAEQVKEELADAPNGARYSIYIKWKSSKSAHVFVAEKVDGVVKYLDPQTGETNAHYFERGVRGGFGFFRMDDKPLTTDAELITQTVKKGGKQ